MYLSANQQNFDFLISIRKDSPFMTSMHVRRDIVWSWSIFFCLLCVVVGHTIWATSLDGFTVDEPYHIAAGATYLRLGDYRANPEHPPLVKLVAALAEPASVLHVAPLGKS
jgi:hypothetical protein